MDWRYALFAILTLLITAIVGYGAYKTARLLRSWQPQENLLLLPAENALRAAVLVICLLLGRGSGLPPETLGWQIPNAGSQIVTGALVGLGLALIFVGMGRFVTRYTDTRFYRSILELVVPRSRREAGLLPFALLLSVLFEEVLFRSLLIGGLSPLLPTAWLIIGFSAIFGLLHSPQGTWGIVGAGTAGAIFGLMFVWHQSLLTPLVAHFVANGVQIWLASLEFGPSSTA
ncbi:MAG: CPBP family intramembrane metalloprotease [Caldilineaceae bacterium SB0665_bin_25]|nr:CPBP family intramembrane metalloprotease [Caldilineaceae bacterium SB0665_bin_25]